MSLIYSKRKFIDASSNQLDIIFAPWMKHEVHEAYEQNYLERQNSV